MARDSRPERIRVAVAVIVEDGRLLIAHRFPDAKLPNLWEFPGGKIQGGEAPEECAVREIAEELGIEIEDLWFYVARRVSGSPRAIGCQEWLWVWPDELARYPLPDASEPVLAALRSGGWLPA
jgi:8-oxo-dGTP diphosphatase